MAARCRAAGLLLAAALVMMAAQAEGRALQARKRAGCWLGSSVQPAVAVRCALAASAGTLPHPPPPVRGRTWWRPHPRRPPPPLRQRRRRRLATSPSILAWLRLGWAGGQHRAWLLTGRGLIPAVSASARSQSAPASLAPALALLRAVAPPWVSSAWMITIAVPGYSACADLVVQPHAATRTTSRSPAEQVSHVAAAWYAPAAP